MNTSNAYGTEKWKEKQTGKKRSKTEIDDTKNKLNCNLGFL